MGIEQKGWVRYITLKSIKILLTQHSRFILINSEKKNNIAFIIWITSIKVN